MQAPRVVALLLHGVRRIRVPVPDRKLFLEVCGEPSPVHEPGRASCDSVHRRRFWNSHDLRPDDAGESKPTASTSVLGSNPTRCRFRSDTRGVCPCVPLGEISWLNEMPANFDLQFAERVVPVDPEQRTAMGSRYFPGPRGQADRLQRHHSKIHRSHSALQGRAASPSLRGKRSSCCRARGTCGRKTRRRGSRRGT